MKYTPYPFQSVAIDHAVEFLRTAEPMTRQLYAGPTGIGKSVIELLVQERLGQSSTMIVTPRVEIVDGMLDKLGAPVDAEGHDYNLWTPVTLRNRLVSGAVRHPKHVIYDETHHHEASTWQQVDLLSGLCPSIGYTASPYRGTPRSTRSFLDNWGDVLWIITYQEAIEQGYVRMPSMEILPLVDDDIVDVRGGEFDVTSLEAHTVKRLGDMAEHARRWYVDGKWDKATIFALPGTVACEELHAELSKRGLPCAIVGCAHSRKSRPTIFDAVERGILALIHINVVQEGVDLRLRRLVDLAPCLSPVKWVQQLGRIMRPWDGVPEYICTNRNILRHAYILQGVVPVNAVVETERKFGPTQRAHSRVLGLEAIGRFKPSTTRLLNGAQLYVYSLSAFLDGVAIEFCCLVPPASDPIWASKVNRVVDGVKEWGTWARCEAPLDLRGFASIGTREPSPKQKAWWDRSAHRFGLDPDQPVDRKSFQALPVLSDVGEYL